ncbi:MAG: ribonuclease III [Acidobacteria bacterium]|nr:MAG: ribonuclease III [Acidobacteriota bacterium]
MGAARRRPGAGRGGGAAHHRVSPRRRRGGPRGPVRQRAGTARAECGLPVPRPRPARARADAPIARPRGRQRRRVRQRIDGIPRRFRARLRNRGHNEGQKSKLKASLVSSASLARLGEQLDLGSFLILGRGEEKTGGRRKHAIIADCYEALIAAIYLDGGIEPARAFIERQFASLIEEARRTGAAAVFTEDWKSALQEWLQSHGRGLPVYRIIEEIGPPHRRTFVIEVQVEGDPIARAEGRSKKEAAQAAAKAALEVLSSG